MKHHRNIVSEKQQFISILNTVFAKATSQQSFFKLLQEQGLELYSRRGVIQGIQGKRKFRFKTLGYDAKVLKLLNKMVEKNVRLEALKRIREQQNKHSLGKERIRKRG